MQRYYQQQEEARRRAANQARVRDAQARRAQSEQQARIAEQQRRQQATAQQRRTQDITQRRIQRARQHTVKKGDTPESIASTYGVEPSAISGQVPRLRPGQRIPVPQADLGQYNEQRREGYQPQGGGGVVQPGIIPTMPAAQSMMQWGIGALPTVAKAINRLAKYIGRDYGGPDFPQPEGVTRVTGAIADYTEPSDQLETSRAFQLATGQDIERTNLAQYNEARRIPGGVHDQMEADVAQAEFDKGNFAAGMRYTGQALAYAWEAMSKGDPNWRQYLESTMPGQEGQIVMVITDGRWDTGPMREQFTDDMWNKVEELGFEMVEDGLWMMPQILPPDYGMGDYSYPGYGGGYGGGGGDYEYLSRGGEMRRKAGGGVSSGERYRVFPEGVAPAHWRI